MPAAPGPQDLRGGPRDLQLGVAVDQLVPLHHGRQVALVGDVEEHGEAPGHEADDVQLPDRQGIEVERDRDGYDGRRPAEVADDQDRTSPEPVHPHARGQAEQDERQELDGGEQAELERGDLQEGRRDQGQRELRDRGPEDRDGLRGPQLEEVGMAQQAATRAWHQAGSLSSRRAWGSDLRGGRPHDALEPSVAVRAVAERLVRGQAATAQEHGLAFWQHPGAALGVLEHHRTGDTVRAVVTGADGHGGELSGVVHARVSRCGGFNGMFAEPAAADCPASARTPLRRRPGR